MRDFGECEQQCRDPEIVRHERRSRFVIRNPNRGSVRVIRIDGCVITEGRRCDWLFIPTSGQVEIFAELKGSAVGHGIEQIRNTIPQVSEDPAGLRKFCYVVSSSVPKMQTRLQRDKGRFRRAYNATLVVKARVAEHPL